MQRLPKSTHSSKNKTLRHVCWRCKYNAHSNTPKFNKKNINITMNIKAHPPSYIFYAGGSMNAQSVHERKNRCKIKVSKVFAFFAQAWPTRVVALLARCKTVLIVDSFQTFNRLFFCISDANLSDVTIVLSISMPSWINREHLIAADFCVVTSRPYRPIHSGVLLKMEVGIRKGAWRRAWRYPAYLWSLRWVYAVKKPGGW